jgi:hypothetical protein
MMTIICGPLTGERQLPHAEWTWHVGESVPTVFRYTSFQMSVLSMQIDGDELQWVKDRWPDWVGRWMSVQTIVGDMARTIVANIHGHERHLVDRVLVQPYSTGA